MTKIKVLEPPTWITWLDDEYCKEDAEETIKQSGYTEIRPRFNRNGHYLLNNSIAIIEYAGRAFLAEKEAFVKELKILSHRLLSFEEVEAIRVLHRGRICPPQLLEKYYFDQYVKDLNRLFYSTLRHFKTNDES